MVIAHNYLTVSDTACKLYKIVEVTHTVNLGSSTRYEHTNQSCLNPM